MDEEHEKHEKDADELSPVPERDQAKLAVPTLDLAVSTSPSLQESDVRTLSRPPSRNTSPTSDTPATVTAVSDEADPEAQREPDIYDRFSPARKRMIVAIVSYAAFIGRE
jgi:hypothetical protein